MTRDELLERLKGYEWKDIEFKLAARDVPNDAFKSVSAFANTSGGWLVFGVKEHGGGFVIEGVIEVDKVQNDFLSALRGRQKFNHEIAVTESAIHHEGATVLAFFVPESPRTDKPIYISNDIRQSFIRRGAGDEKCTLTEIERLLRDASGVRFEAEPLELDPAKCFDEPSLRWYREQYNRTNPGRTEILDDHAFLHHGGFLAEHQSKLLPTRMGILVLGADAYVRQVLPRMVVDVQRYTGKFAEYSPEFRWSDRLQSEENLVKSWQSLTAFYFREAERPFGVDATSMRRLDAPPDYISFREAAINLLIHQDYGDHRRTPMIRFFTDVSEFFNPGDALASTEQLLDPGDKEVRNPGIVGAFRRIGLSDQAGSGVGAIFSSWRKLGNLPPVLDNNKADKTFRLQLWKEKLQTQEQILAQARLGVSLSEPEAAVFSYLMRKGSVNLVEIKGLTGLNGPSVQQLVQRLTVQVLIQPLSPEAKTFGLASHLMSILTPQIPLETPTNPEGMAQTPESGATVQVTAQVHSIPPALVQLTPAQWMILEHSDTPRTLSELLALTNYRQRAFFKAKQVSPLIEAGLLRMTQPDKPTSSRQQYLITGYGLKLKLARNESPHESTP
ncbi:MAG: putative DNA binding domain-containing protein [Fibrobacterota bacterium]|nr:MAG: putative DNA binding domain-containing protein [Fibrobacterota bacterium]